MHRLKQLGSAATLVALLGSAAMLPAVSQAQVTVGLSIHLAPPALPVYEQPPMPTEGYIWVPGYWAWSEDTGYYWVPGTWVEPPMPDLLWTPGYWGWIDGAYLWHAGYWGPTVGFYGGVDYGFGYSGRGYVGGRWEGGRFFYNNAVNNIPVGVHVTNVYHETVINHVTVNRVSFNGGSGGIQARPTSGELAAEHARHVMPVSAQLRQEQGARGNPQLRASLNNGHPAIAATARPGQFQGPGVVHARGHQGPQAGPAAPAPPTAFGRPNEHGRPAQAPQPFERSSGGEHHVGPTPAPNERPSAAAETREQHHPQPQPQHAAPARPEAEHRAPEDHHKSPELRR